MTVVDASVLIALLDPSDAQHERAIDAMVDVGPDALAISPITHAEILVGPAREGTLEQTQSALHSLGLVDVPLPEDAPVRLASLRCETSAKLPDCCVLLAAQQTQAPVLTFDDRLARAADAVGLRVV